MFDFISGLLSNAFGFVAGVIIIICIVLGLVLSCRGIRTPMFANGWWDEVKGRLFIGLFGGVLVGAILAAPLNAARDFFKVEKTDITSQQQYQNKQTQQNHRKERQNDQNDESTLDKLDKMSDAISSTDQSKNNNDNRQNKNNISNPVKNASQSGHTLNDVSLGNISIGFSVEAMYKNMGKERTMTHDNDSPRTHYKYDDLDVVVINGKVIGFVSNTGKPATPRGIKQGDSVQSVLRAYGDPYAKSDYEGTTLYEYKFTSLDNRTCLMRFAIKNSTVDYISGRVMD